MQAIKETALTTISQLPDRTDTEEILSSGFVTLEN